MARIRSIKPDFFTSEDIVSLTPLARLLYIALWCEADREGRMVWKPQTFKLRYFPGDDVSIQDLCAELTGRNLVVLYGENLAYIPTFSDHQHVNPRESASSLPEPDKKGRVSTRGQRVATGANHDANVQVGREGKGRIYNASVDASFEVFWTAYPRKQAKPRALKAFKKISPANGDFERMLAALEVAKKSESWTKDNGKYIPHAATWLNDRRFEDEVAAAPAVKIDL